MGKIKKDHDFVDLKINETNLILDLTDKTVLIQRGGSFAYVNNIEILLLKYFAGDITEDELIARSGEKIPREHIAVYKSQLNAKLDGILPRKGKNSAL